MIDKEPATCGAWPEPDLEPLLREAAAVAVQGAWRGNAARKQLLRESAAVMVQSAWRGARERAESKAGPLPSSEERAEIEPLHAVQSHHKQAPECRAGRLPPSDEHAEIEPVHGACPASHLHATTDHSEGCPPAMTRPFSQSFSHSHNPMDVGSCFPEPCASASGYPVSCSVTSSLTPEAEALHQQAMCFEVSSPGNPWLPRVATSSNRGEFQMEPISPCGGYHSPLESCTGAIQTGANQVSPCGPCSSFSWQHPCPPQNVSLGSPISLPTSPTKPCQKHAGHHKLSQSHVVPSQMSSTSAVEPISQETCYCEPRQSQAQTCEHVRQQSQQCQSDMYLPEQGPWQEPPSKQTQEPQVNPLQPPDMRTLVQPCGQELLRSRSHPQIPSQSCPHQLHACPAEPVQQKESEWNEQKTCQNRCSRAPRQSRPSHRLQSYHCRVNQQLANNEEPLLVRSQPNFHNARSASTQAGQRQQNPRHQCRSQSRPSNQNCAGQQQLPLNQAPQCNHQGVLQQRPSLVEHCQISTAEDGSQHEDQLFQSPAQSNNEEPLLVRSHASLHHGRSTSTQAGQGHQNPRHHCGSQSHKSNHKYAGQQQLLLNQAQQCNHEEALQQRQSLVEPCEMSAAEDESHDEDQLSQSPAQPNNEEFVLVRSQSNLNHARFTSTQADQAHRNPRHHGRSQLHQSNRNSAGQQQLLLNQAPQYNHQGALQHRPNLVEPCQMSAAEDESQHEDQLSQSPAQTNQEQPNQHHQPQPHILQQSSTKAPGLSPPPLQIQGKAGQLPPPNPQGPLSASAHQWQSSNLQDRQSNAPSTSMEPLARGSAELPRKAPCREAVCAPTAGPLADYGSVSNPDVRSSEQDIPVRQQRQWQQQFHQGFNSASPSRSPTYGSSQREQRTSNATPNRQQRLSPHHQYQKTTLYPITRASRCGMCHANGDAGNPLDWQAKKRDHEDEVPGCIPPPARPPPLDPGIWRVLYGSERGSAVYAEKYRPYFYEDAACQSRLCKRRSEDARDVSDEQMREILEATKQFRQREAELADDVQRFRHNQSELTSELAAELKNHDAELAAEKSQLRAWEHKLQNSESRLQEEIMRLREREAELQRRSKGSLPSRTAESVRQEEMPCAREWEPEPQHRPTSSLSSRSANRARQYVRERHHGGGGSLMCSQSASPEPVVSEQHTQDLKRHVQAEVSQQMEPLQGLRQMQRQSVNGSSIGTVPGEQDYSRRLEGLEVQLSAGIQALEEQLAAVDSRVPQQAEGFTTPLEPIDVDQATRTAAAVRIQCVERGRQARQLLDQHRWHRTLARGSGNHVWDTGTGTLLAAAPEWYRELHQEVEPLASPSWALQDSCADDHLSSTRYGDLMMSMTPRETVSRQQAQRAAGSCKTCDRTLDALSEPRYANSQGQLFVSSSASTCSPECAAHGASSRHWYNKTPAALARRPQRLTQEEPTQQTSQDHMDGEIVGRHLDAGMSSSLADQRQQEEAAIIVQRNFRGYLVRRGLDGDSRWDGSQVSDCTCSASVVSAQTPASTSLLLDQDGFAESCASLGSSMRAAPDPVAWVVDLSDWPQEDADSSSSKVSGSRAAIGKRRMMWSKASAEKVVSTQLPREIRGVHGKPIRSATMSKEQLQQEQNTSGHGEMTTSSTAGLPRSPRTASCSPRSAGVGPNRETHIPREGSITAKHSTGGQASNTPRTGLARSATPTRTSGPPPRTGVSSVGAGSKARGAGTRSPSKGAGGTATSSSGNAGGRASSTKSRGASANGEPATPGRSKKCDSPSPRQGTPTRSTGGRSFALGRKPWEPKQLRETQLPDDGQTTASASHWMEVGSSEKPATSSARSPRSRTAQPSAGDGRGVVTGHSSSSTGFPRKTNSNVTSSQSKTKVERDAERLFGSSRTASRTSCGERVRASLSPRKVASSSPRKLRPSHGASEPSLGYAHLAGHARPLATTPPKNRNNLECGSDRGKPKGPMMLVEAEMRSPRSPGFEPVVDELLLARSQDEPSLVAGGSAGGAVPDNSSTGSEMSLFDYLPAKQCGAQAGECRVDEVEVRTVQDAHVSHHGPGAHCRGAQDADRHGTRNIAGTCWPTRTPLCNQTVLSASVASASAASPSAASPSAASPSATSLSVMSPLGTSVMNEQFSPGGESFDEAFHEAPVAPWTGFNSLQGNNGCAGCFQCCSPRAQVSTPWAYATPKRMIMPPGG